MYSDGDRKTFSELQREALAKTKEVAEKTAQLERTRRALGRMQQTGDQIFSLFAQGVKVNEREAFLDLLLSGSRDIEVGTFPLLPVVLALANGCLPNVKSIRAANNEYVDDGTVIFLAHVLRFAPPTLKVNILDISGTKVTEKGLFFLLEMMSECPTEFTLIAKNRTPELPSLPTTFKEAFEEVLKRIKNNEKLTVAL